MTNVIIQERDEVLFENFRRTGEAEYFKELVERHQHRLFNVSFKLLGNRCEAEEVVQETFTRVLGNVDKFKRHAHFKAWAHTIAHNLCVDILRQKRRRSYWRAEVAESKGEYLVGQVADHRLNPAERLDIAEQQKFLLQTLDKIPEAQKAVIVLHDIEGFSYKEIATITGTELGTVRSRLFYARNKLRRLLRNKQ